MHAVRNIQLCTKDCLCLYVCPVGATDTETGQIDAIKCIRGCRICVDACPSHAISLVPEKDEYPPQQKKEDKVRQALYSISNSKVEQEQIAAKIAKVASGDSVYRLAEAIRQSNHIMAEDLLREAGFMLPQSGNTHSVLQKMLENPANDFPVDIVKDLLELLDNNDL